MKSNYHTHTMRCKHALDSDEEYVLCAIAAGFDEIGFSDHTPWPFEEGYVSSIRMDLSEFEDYYNSLSLLKDKYKDQISIKIGLEVEYYPKYMNWMKQFVIEQKVDYIIFGNHFLGDESQGIYFGGVSKDNAKFEAYIQTCIDGLSTGLYSYLAHPDLFMRSNRVFDAYTHQLCKKLCEYCKEKDIPLEYNLEGLLSEEFTGRKTYPCDSFWKIAGEVGNKAIIGNDAHKSESLLRDDLRAGAITKLQAYGLEIVEQIPLKW